MKHFWEGYLELLADLLLILFGAFLIYVFIVIEVMGSYGQEPNAIIRRAEIVMGVLVMLLGTYHLILDWKRLRK